MEQADREVLGSGGRFIKQANRVSGILNQVYEAVDELASFSSTKQHFRDAVASMNIVPDETVQVDVTSPADQAVVLTSILTANCKFSFRLHMTELMADQLRCLRWPWGRDSIRVVGF